MLEFLKFRAFVPYLRYSNQTFHVLDSSVISMFNSRETNVFCDHLPTERSSTNITSQVLLVSVKNILLPNFVLNPGNRLFIEYIHSRAVNTNFISVQLDYDTHRQIPSRMFHRRSQQTIQAFTKKSTVL